MSNSADIDDALEMFDRAGCEMIQYKGKGKWKFHLDGSWCTVNNCFSSNEANLALNHLLMTEHRTSVDLNLI